MKRVKIIESVLKMRFEEIYSKYNKEELSTEEASEILGISVRTFLRKRDRYEAEDFDGRFDKRLGKPSGRKALDREIKEVIDQYSNRYRGFSVKHFHEFLGREHKVIRSYSWTKKILQEKGLVKKEKKGGKHRQRRERRPMAGMMLHQDGSTHEWIEGLGYKVDLIVTMDDATSVITSGFFVEQEGTESSLRGIKETIEKYGLFCTFYTDRGSHYSYTPEAGGKIDKHCLTEVGRSLKELGIKHIVAYSPQARGRSERLFGTLQDRLPKELALRGITTLEKANKYLVEEYIPRHNQQFSVKAQDPRSCFITWGGKDLNEILCFKEERIVQKDNTVKYCGLVLQIPKSELRHHYVRSTIEVRKYINKTIGIFYGHHCIGRYDSLGTLIELENYRKAA